MQKRKRKNIEYIHIAIKFIVIKIEFSICYVTKNGYSNNIYHCSIRSGSFTSSKWIIKYICMRIQILQWIQVDISMFKSAFKLIHLFYSVHKRPPFSININMLYITN